MCPTMPTPQEGRKAHAARAFRIRYTFAGHKQTQSHRGPSNSFAMAAGTLVWRTIGLCKLNRQPEILQHTAEAVPENGRRTVTHFEHALILKVAACHMRTFEHTNSWCRIRLQCHTINRPCTLGLLLKLRRDGGCIGRRVWRSHLAGAVKVDDDGEHVRIHV